MNSTEATADAEYEYTFKYVRGEADIRALLAVGWEPVPNVVPVTIPPGRVATPSVYVFLRKRKS